MHTVENQSRADQVRRYVLESIIQPSRAAGKQTVTVRAGDVQKGLGWWNLVPSVCSALDAREFLRMSQTRLLRRNGPAQSTTVEWEFALSDAVASDEGTSGSASSKTEGRRLIATWDGTAFKPIIVPDELEVGQRVVLMVSVPTDLASLAGKYARYVGTLSREEGEEMLAEIERAFETISDEW